MRSSRSRRAVLAAVAGVLAAPAAAEAADAPTLTVPTPCVAGECRPIVRYVPDPGALARVEVAWDGTGFAAPTDCATACTVRGPAFATPGRRRVGVRVTVLGAEVLRVELPVTVVPAAPPEPEAPDPADCPPLAAGEQCGPGNGRRTPGGGEKVSHVGWPAITGILWKVTAAAGRHDVTGGPANDELLGHHGDDVLRGGPGRDVLWGDWDPRDNGTGQVDRLSGGAGADWLYSSHGRNAISGGPGKDYVWAYYGRGTIDCGPGFDTLRIRMNAPYRVTNCERIKNFCSFGSKPGNAGGCYKPGEKPRRGG